MNETDLHDYQRHGVNHILVNPFCGLLLDMGLGKTVTTLTAVNKLMFEYLQVYSALVVAPKRVAENVWANEIDKWDHLHHLRISKVVGNEMQRKEALRSKADIHIISRDNVAWLCDQYGGGMLPFDMLILDESSSFKNPKSQRFKALRRVQSFKRVVILTGTPAPNSLIDLWSQIYLLDRGARLGKTLTSYRDRYFKANQRNGSIIYNYKPQKGGEEEIHSKIKDICMSMKAEDYLKMPQKMINVVDLYLDEIALGQYKAFEKEQVLELVENDISAVNAAALSNKLLQFASGAVYDENRNWHEVHNLKIDALEEIIENANGKPVLIAYWFKHDLERILKRLKKYDPVQLKKDQDIKNWNEGKVKVMLMHPASGGHGLNLQKGGNTIVWFSMTWSLELYEQLNARLYRQGQKSDKVHIHHLAVKGTLDMDVLMSLKSKKTKQENLMEAIKKRIREYGKR